MATKVEIKQRIFENKRRSKLERQREKLEFLVPVKISDEFLELNRSVSLRNSWIKKSKYLLFGIGCVALFFWGSINTNISDGWLWGTFTILTITSTLFFTKFFENKTIIKIAPDGLTTNIRTFTKWSDIEYLYFRTEYNDEGDFEDTYLVVNLINGLKFEILISNLQWTADRLGTALYQCMKKYKKL